MSLQIYLELRMTERQKLYPLLELGRIVGNDTHFCHLFYLYNPQDNQLLMTDQKEEMATCISRSITI